MKLYTYDPAPNPQRLTHFMKYKGIEIETETEEEASEEEIERFRELLEGITVDDFIDPDETP